MRHVLAPRAPTLLKLSQGVKHLRAKIATLHDYQHSIPEMIDNNNGVYLQSNENTHKPLRLRLAPPVLKKLGERSDNSDILEPQRKASRQY